MKTKFQEFATDLALHLQQAEPGLSVPLGNSPKNNPDNNSKLLVDRGKDQQASLDLTPVSMSARPQPATAKPWFASIKTSVELLSAYERCRSETRLEDSLPGTMLRVHEYAEKFRLQLLSGAKTGLSDNEAELIAVFVAQLDCYSAIKSVECLLASPADRALLAIAQQRDWIVYMDHLAIRCGSQQHGDAQRIAEFLIKDYGYVTSQVEGEDYYQFDDGWDAYPLYKMLDNGLMLRLFVDESSQGFPQQIIQHWHHVYGFTAHHLAMRVARFSQQSTEQSTEQSLVAVPLSVVISALNEQGVNTMTPTGSYTAGLLEQGFTKPAHTPDVPQEIKQTLASVKSGL